MRKANGGIFDPKGNNLPLYPAETGSPPVFVAKIRKQLHTKTNTQNGRTAYLDRFIERIEQVP